ncbi:mucin-2 isoform X1 [Labeo rohita]|uniref:mucin-2 isoform X1 n=1 Tax=Labeo rohita TaxID=84645 RepID=UPI0021E3082D|nr:mucin-2 isoform X1 [Labeo rohita]
MALREAALLGIIIVFSGHIHSVFTAQNVCKTYGSGIFHTFNKTVFHLKTSCPVTLTHFTHAGVDCHIIVQRGPDGLMDRVEIIVNKITTLIHNKTVTVEGSSISLPYDHTYQHVFHYGIYTRLQSKVLPLSVTWYSLADGVSSLRVQLDQNLVEGMSGLCGHQNSSETMQQLISSSVFFDGQCLIQDSTVLTNAVCKEIMSHAYECLATKYKTYLNLCYKNMNGLWHQESNCSFFKELSLMCGSSSPLWSVWRSKTNCHQPHCPGDLHYVEMGPAFPPTCSNPQIYTTELTSTCLPAEGKVLNDRVDGYHSISVEECPCVHAKKMYEPGQERRTKCQTCTCIRGNWACSANTCPAKCIIEGQFITTFDGKQYSMLDKCTFVAAKGVNWTLNIQYSGQGVVIEKAYLNINQERYTFSANSIQLNNIEISDLSQTESTTVFWQSSMFIQVQTSFGLKMQVQISPEIQIYLNLPPTENTKGLCGTLNNDTSDDFTTFSGIIESSVQLFAQSWSMGTCTLIPGCINTDNEMFAEVNCDQLKNPEGVFAVCHEYVPVSPFVEACVKRTCQCTTALQECLCVSFGNYAKACAAQGITVGDWRAETNCIPLCMGNLRFAYTTLACNRTCRSLSGPDATCEVVDDPVEGCGCTSDSHLSNQQTCSPLPLCSCHHPGGITPPGPVVIGGRQCLCENGQLHCPKVCNCTVDKICVDCSQIPVNTAYRTCESLTKPASDDNSCISGCYCPDGLFEDHNGGCVTHENCTCEFSGRVYETGQSVETNCKICTCRGGEWFCVDEACSGVCEVFGNGQYRTFDSRWYRFDGHCQYTLVKDAGSSGEFAIKTESVPCCDESLTCSRAISVELLGAVTLMLSDMKVTERHQAGDALLAEPLYFIHTVGLYIIISVPRLGITVIWDKHTRVTIQLEPQWRGQVLGLCGNFDGKVTNDLLTSSSSEVFSVLDFGNSWKTAAPPCSDVTHEIFPCERHSYCAAWAQRRCMILRSDTFKDCHLKVDPEPYYQACVLESCSCEFEGKFLGFCTAVAAYAEACSGKDVCINWRTPDLCPVYCDYYNEVGQCTWHYNPCGQVKTCGTNNHFTGKLEGCYPKCPEETPYYDKNLGKCTTLDNCTCNFRNRVFSPPDEMCTSHTCCKCIEGQIVCNPIFTSTTTTTTMYYTSTAQPPTTIITHTATTQPLTSQSTKQYTTPLPTTERTTEYTTTTRPSTTEIITETYTTPMEKTTTTQPPPTESTTKHRTTTHPLTTKSTTETYTAPVEETTTTQPPSTESTTEHRTTTRLSTIESTTETYTTPVEETTTTQPPPTESTTEHRTTTRLSTIESTTETYTTPVEETTTTQPPPTESTTEHRTTTRLSTIESTTETYTTPVEETTTTQPPPTESTTEHRTTIGPLTTESTTETYTTPVKETATTQQPPPESTTEHRTTTRPSTVESTTETYTTPIEETTTAQPPPTESTTLPSTTETTTETYTTPMEETTTTQPPPTESTTLSSTTETTTETYTTPMEETTTTHPSTTKSTTETYTTPVEETTTTQQPPTESTTEHITTTRPSTTEITTETYTTPMEETTTAQPPPTESTTLPSTTETTTETYTTPMEETTTTHPSTTKSTTETYTTPVEETTTTQQPPTESTTEHITKTRPSTTEITTETYTTPMEETTTAQPPPTESTTLASTTETTTETYTTPVEETTTTHPSTTKSTTETYTTPVEETTTTQPPPTESTTELRTTTRPPTTEITTETYTTPVEEATTTPPPPAESTTKHITTTRPSTTDRTTEMYSTPMEETTTTHLPTSESTTEYTTQPPTSESTTQPTISTKQYTTTTQPTTEATTSVKYSTTVSTVSTPGIVIVTGPTISSKTSFQEASTTSNPTAITSSLTSLLSTTVPTTEHKTPEMTSSLTSLLSTTVPTTEHTTPAMTPSPTSLLSTTAPTTEHTTSVCECKDVMRNQSWPCGETWREDCTDKVCKGGVIEVAPIACPTTRIRTDCPRSKMSFVKDEETCCDRCQCDCECQVYGDPHYISFQGIAFDFMDNCTYTLVEEQILQHRLSITVDNYYCVPEIDNSCSRGIKLKYWNDTATLMVTEEFTVESTLNEEIIKPPYENQVFKFENSGGQANIYIKPIRSYVSLSSFNNLLINLAMEHFYNNTQGQCGVCGGQSCIRRNGVIEDDNCCDKTAYDWVVEDPLKPYCKSALTNVPCVPPPPPSPPPPTPSPPPCNPTICDLLHHEVFAECGERINLTDVEKNCQFDYCSYKSSVGACSSLEYAASECKRIGICVDWRYLTNGSCEITCPPGMMYDECRESPNDVCRGGVRVSATSVVGLRSGCFCPDDQILAEEHKQICVPDCTPCKGPLGEPMPVGAVWESNCHICTCNNQTRTEECIPKPQERAPVCSAYSILVSDCCDNQICVDKSCEYNGKIYKVGDRWTDPSRPCESFSCSQTGMEVEKTVCPLQTCAEDLRVWDEHHCCYSCNVSCTARLTRMNLTISDCTEEVELPICEGQCETDNRWVHANGTLQLEQSHQCCKERGYEMREITLTCSKNTSTHFTYKHVTGCECKVEG